MKFNEIAGENQIDLAETGFSEAVAIRLFDVFLAGRIVSDETVNDVYFWNKVSDLVHVNAIRIAAMNLNNDIMI